MSEKLSDVVEKAIKPAMAMLLESVLSFEKVAYMMEI